MHGQQPPPYGHAPAYAPPPPPHAAQAPWSPANGAAKAPVWGLGPAGVAFFFGVITFLIAGLRGHSAGWEMLAAPTLLAMVAAVVAAIPGVIALTRKGVLLGLATMGLGGFGAFLALVGFLLGA